MKTYFIRPLAILILALITSQAAQAQSGKVKVKIKTNENGQVSIEEQEFDISEGFDLDQFLQDQDIDIHVDDTEGKKMIEIIVNGEANSFSLDTDENVFMWHNGHEAPEMTQKAFLGVYHDDTYAGQGVRISDVVTGSTAELMGLQAGDIITEVDGEMVINFSDLKRELDTKVVGDEVAIRYEREGAEDRVKAELGTSTEAFSFHHDGQGKCEAMTFDLEDIGKEMEEQLKELGLQFKNSASFDFDGKEMEEMMKQLEEQFSAFGLDIDTDGGFSKTHVIVIMEDISTDELSEVNAGADPKISPSNDLALDGLRFFPNPSDGQFDLQFETADEGDLNVIIYDAKGTKVYYEMLGDFSGEYSNKIDISRRPAGNYFLQIIQNGKTYSKKLIKE